MLFETDGPRPKGFLNSHAISAFVKVSISANMQKNPRDLNIDICFTFLPSPALERPHIDPEPFYYPVSTFYPSEGAPKTRNPSPHQSSQVEGEWWSADIAPREGKGRRYLNKSFSRNNK